MFLLDIAVITKLIDTILNWYHVSIENLMGGSS